jgi:hypothetical protein
MSRVFFWKIDFFENWLVFGGAKKPGALQHRTFPKKEVGK